MWINQSSFRSQVTGLEVQMAVVFFIFMLFRSPMIIYIIMGGVIINLIDGVGKGCSSDKSSTSSHSQYATNQSPPNKVDVEKPNTNVDQRQVDNNPKTNVSTKVSQDRFDQAKRLEDARKAWVEGCDKRLAGHQRLSDIDSRVNTVWRELTEVVQSIPVSSGKGPLTLKINDQEAKRLAERPQINNINLRISPIDGEILRLSEYEVDRFDQAKKLEGSREVAMKAWIEGRDKRLAERQAAQGLKTQVEGLDVRVTSVEGNLAEALRRIPVSDSKTPKGTTSLTLKIKSE